MVITEIFRSIQGESTHAGLPCIFVRLTGCNLRCNYCDTEYAFYEGRKMSLAEIIEQLDQYRCNLVEITGKNGAPIAADAGPYRLVVPFEKRAARWVKHATDIGLANALP